VTVGATTGRDLPGVRGEAGSVAEFVAAWRHRVGGGSELAMRMRMYRLGRLVRPATVSGSARIAGARERDLLVDWVERFQLEAHAERPSQAPRLMVDQRLSEGQAWIWWDRGRPVSFAGRSAAVGGVARVGPVYTPPDCRRHGYSSAVTAAATEAALRAGAEHVVLYTDLANPTANAIYPAIGYLPDHDAEEWRLVSPG
jgi:predicted GNAT family acetyltransferase